MSLKLYTFDGQIIKETYLIPNNFTGIVEYSNGTKTWWVNAKRHRIDGPAIEYYSGRKEWWVDDIRHTEEQCKLLHSIMKLKGIT